jgi:hypothetical protein
VLTSKNPQLIEWWKQAVRQGIQVDMEPILFFKFDRSKWFVATYLTMEVENEIIINYGTHNFSIYNVDDINLMEINWILKAQEA